MDKLYIGPHALENPDGLGDWSRVSRVRKYCFSFPRDPLNPGDILICRAPNTDYLTPWLDDGATRLKPARATAENWVYGRILPTLAANPHVFARGVQTWWELDNEPDWKPTWSPAQAATAIGWYGSFHKAALEIAGAASVRLIVGNWSTQTPSHDRIPREQLWMHYALSGVFQTMQTTGGGMGWHSYDDPVTPLWYPTAHVETIRARAGWDVPQFVTELGVEDWSKKFSPRDYARKYLLSAELRCGPGRQFRAGVFFTLGGSWPSFKVNASQSAEIVSALAEVVNAGEEKTLTYKLNPARARALNIRTAPGANHQKVSELSLDEEVTIIETEKAADGGLWAAIKRDRFTGWVNFAYLKEAQHAP